MQSIVDYHIVHLKFTTSLRKILTMARFSLNWFFFGFDNEKKFSKHFHKIEVFLNFKTKSSLSTFIFIFFTIFEILKRKFYVVL